MAVEVEVRQALEPAQRADVADRGASELEEGQAREPAQDAGVRDPPCGVLGQDGGGQHPLSRGLIPRHRDTALFLQCSAAPLIVNRNLPASAYSTAVFLFSRNASDALEVSWTGVSYRSSVATSYGVRSPAGVIVLKRPA